MEIEWRVACNANFGTHSAEIFDTQEEAIEYKGTCQLCFIQWRVKATEWSKAPYVSVCVYPM